MTEKAWYKAWFNSPFYHKLYFERDDKEAAAFIKQLIAHLQPTPGCRMLDVACGKGRHSKTLASLGFDVTGIDISPESIEAAKKFESTHLSFFVHDMRLPFYSNYFSFAFNFFTSFGYFNTRREHDDAIRTICKSLQPSGKFIIDYLNVHFAEDHLEPTAFKQIGDTYYDIHRWHDTTHFYKKIIVHDPSLEAPLSFVEKVAKFTLGDFTDMLSYQGMQVQEVFGNYQLGHYDVRQTPRLILIAEKE